MVEALAARPSRDEIVMGLPPSLRETDAVNESLITGAAIRPARI
jgi:hypothetical protein